MGKGSGRREGANDKAFKAAAWPPESPHVRPRTLTEAAFRQVAYATRYKWQSECCEALPVDQVDDDGSGHCSKCGEPTLFFRMAI